MSERVAALAERLRKGSLKTRQKLDTLSDQQWDLVLYREPHVWTVRDMVAHLLSAEQALLQGARDVAAGGPGAPEGLDYDAYNASEQTRLAGIPPHQLLADLEATRQEVAAWVAGLDEACLDLRGHHPALGEITVEEYCSAIYGHQLTHVRDLQALLRA